MKLNKIVVTSVLSLVTGFFGFSQINLNALSAEELEQRGIEQIMAESDGPRPYQYVNNNDIVFQKTVYETIPLDERANLIYYFPLQDSEDSKSLFTILKDAILNKDIPNVYYYDDLKDRISTEEIKKRFTRTDTSEYGKELLSYGEQISEEYIVTTQLRSSDVVEYRTRGVWYIDRKSGELNYRLLAIAPVAVDINTKGQAEENLIELFWVFFPDARQLLYQNYAVNEKNERMRNNFDYLLNSRRYSATIYKTENIYGEDLKGLVGDNALYQLLEAERIKDNIRNLEDDMWSY